MDVHNPQTEKGKRERDFPLPTPHCCIPILIITFTSPDVSRSTLPLGPALPLHAKFTMWATMVLMYAERSGALRCSYRSCLIVVPSQKRERLGTREPRLCLIVSNSNSEKSINTDRLLAIPCRKQIMNQLILETRNPLSYER